MSLFDFLKKRQKKNSDAEYTEAEATAVSDETIVEEDTDDEIFQAPIKETFCAKVIDRICGINTKTSNAYKMVKTVKEFVIVFEDSEGKFRRVLVGEDMYDAFEEGQVGMLTLLNGQIDSFVLDGE